MTEDDVMQRLRVKERLYAMPGMVPSDYIVGIVRALFETAAEVLSAPAPSDPVTVDAIGWAEAAFDPAPINHTDWDLLPRLWVAAEHQLDRGYP